MNTRMLGRAGEESAALYLTEQGFTVVGRNVRLGHFEADVIAVSDTHIVFAEVKTRRAYPAMPTRFGRPAEAVDREKRRCLLGFARAYLREHGDEYGDRIPNIDIIEVYADPGAPQYRVLAVRRYANAVRPSDEGASHETV